MFQDKDEIYTFLQTTCLPIIVATATILFFFKTTTKKNQTMSIPGNPLGKYPLLGDTLQLLNSKTMASYQVSSHTFKGPYGVHLFYSTNVSLSPVLRIYSNYRNKNNFIGIRWHASHLIIGDCLVITVFW